MPEVYPYEVPEGYKEGMSGGSYDPITGERKSWAQPPQRIALPPPDLGMQDINREALNNALKSAKVDEALKAVDAAVKFQAQQRYQRKLEAALKEPDPTKQAALKAAAGVAEFPIMFGGAGAGSAIRATTPPSVPQITPYQREVLDLKRKALAVPGTSNIPAEFQRDPNKEYITKGGALIPKVKPDATAFQTIRETIPAVAAEPAVEAVPFKKRDLFGIPYTDRLVPDRAEVKAKPAVAARREQIVTRKVPVDASPAPSPKVNEVIKIAPNGKRAVFDADTKKFLRYATD